MKSKGKKKQDPSNRLAELAQAKGYDTAYEFSMACANAGIVSYGLAHEKWTSGRAGATGYDTLLAITKFLGASRIEEVFDP